MREYQQKMLKSKSKIVLCNWNRGKGKTYSIADFINEKINFNKHISILVVGNSKHKTSVILQEKLEKVVDCSKCEVRGVGFEKIIISGIEGNMRYNLVNITITSDIENSRGIKVDYVLCDEYIPSSDELSIFYNSGAKQVYVLGTFNIDYISDKKDGEKFSEKDWINNQIKELMEEFANIPKADNTTKRREVVLDMINRLNHMRIPEKEPKYVQLYKDSGGREVSGLFGNEKKENSGLFENKIESSGLFR